MTGPSLLGRKARSAVVRMRQGFHPLTVRVRHTRVIEQLVLGVCTACEYDCASCSHQAVRYRFRRYQMSLDEVRAFIRVIETSGYRIEHLRLTGPGEPLLWAHLAEGLRLLRASPAIGFIEILSNGLAAERIAPEAWPCFDRLWISLYPETQHMRPRLEALQRRYPRQVRLRPTETFKSPLAPGTLLQTPCVCECPGPMVFDGRVLYFCGPTVFDAGVLAGVDPLDDPSVSGALRPNFLEPDGRRRRWWRLAEVDSRHKVGSHPLCRHCFANSHHAAAPHAHQAYLRVRAAGDVSVREAPDPRESVDSGAGREVIAERFVR